MIQEPNSIKQCIQGMLPDPVGVIKGRVTGANPLRIVAVNNEKLVLNENTVIVPWHLTDYRTVVDIRIGAGDGGLHSHIGGNHPHGPSGEHSQYRTGDGVHSHPDSEGEHIHESDGEHSHVSAIMTAYNALRAGDIVYMLSFNDGKRYYILDREKEMICDDV